MKKKNIYLDCAANCPLDKRVFSIMKPFLEESFMGNSHSIHSFGINASKAVENARVQIAKATSFKPEEIYFTSGATESNNWVLKALAFHELFEEKTPKKHIIVSSIEHSSILRTCKDLEKMGFDITYIDPDENGVVSSKSVKAALRFDTLLVCVMSVNNELGTKNPVNSIGAVAHKNKSLMMSDCTQYLGYGDGFCKLKDRMPNVDYFTFSAHKIYGPTGVGCLIARSRAPLYPFITGGQQESGFRGGTSNTAGIVGLGEAYSLIAQNNYEPLFSELYGYLIEQLKKNKIPFKVNGDPDHKNIVNLNFSAFMHDSELASLYANYNIAVSAGSACDASEDGIETKPSHVLKAIGLSDEEIFNSVRVSFSKYTTKKDIDAFVEVTRILFRESQNEKQ